MKIELSLAIALSLISSSSLGAQAAPSPLKEVRGLPAELYAAPNLVTNTSWISGTISRNVVVLGFKDGVTAAQRRRIYNLVKARAVYVDAEDGLLPLFYLLVVKTHPDACVVKQAADLLEAQPEVRLASPDIVGSFDGNGGMVNVPGTPLGTRDDCPSGIDLLH